MTYFYPRSPCGERLASIVVHLHINVFLSTLSLRRATGSNLVRDTQNSDFYPRSPCGERHIKFIIACYTIDNFYPRSPCGERLQKCGHELLKCGNFYPRSPCGERLATGQIKPGSGTISIHALLAESDRPSKQCAETGKRFLSTLSLRRATRISKAHGRTSAISIHALLAESDLLCTVEWLKRTYFYPRSPCGERLWNPGQIVRCAKFLSTLSLRRATKPMYL